MSTRKPAIRKVAVLVVVVLGLLTVALAAPSARSEPLARGERVTVVGGATVVEFRLPDGTRCVQIPTRGGIDCDWVAPSSPEGGT